MNAEPASGRAVRRERPLVWHRQLRIKPGIFRYSVTRTSAHQLEQFDGERWIAAVAP